MALSAQSVTSISALSEESQALLLKDAQGITSLKGETLISRGDEVSGVFLVQAGTLRIYTMNEKGKQATLYRLSEGEICLLSLNSTLTGCCYPGWVCVESESASVLSLKGAAFRSLFHTDPDIQNLMLDSLTSTISHLLLCIDEALLCDLKERIKNFLIRNSNAQGFVHITHQALADHLGVTREAVSRELSALEHEHIIHKTRNRIAIVNRTAPA